MHRRRHPGMTALVRWLGLAVLQVGLAVAAPQGSAEALRVLFVGNSYTYVNDLPSILKDLAIANRAEPGIQTTMIATPGATLEAHWKQGDVQRALQQERWDYVILQEQSLLPTVAPDQMYRYARLFNALITASGAKTILFVTWARAGKPEMQVALDRAYATLAKELGAQLAPIGSAWQRALSRNPRLALYQGDGSHPTAVGSYVGACVFYAVIYGRPPQQHGGRVGGLAAADILLLHQAAWDAVQAR